jgi:hypothetical protein
MPFSVVVDDAVMHDEIGKPNGLKNFGCSTLPEARSNRWMNVA